MSVAARAALDPGERSDAACRRLLSELDAVLERNAPGIVADLDPKCLHDFRVATRKARSLLGEMKRVFPPKRVRRLRADLGWLGRRTGPLRDLDVHLLELGALPGDGEASADAAALRGYLETWRGREHRTLRRTLRSARYRRVRASFREFLGRGSPARPRRAALVPIAALSARRILKTRRRVLAEGRAIRDDSPPEALHDLRKSCKRLRYLLELFRDLHPAKPMERAIARLKRLQDHLGACQDVQVQRAVLQEFRRHAGASLDAAGRKAVDDRCGALAERERVARTEFAARFARFDSKGAHRKLAAALGRGRG